MKRFRPGAQPFRPSRQLTAGILLALLLAGTQVTTAGEISAWQGRVEERDGITHIHNPSEPLLPTLTLRPEPLWSSGYDPRDEIFGRLGDVAVDDEGNFLLLDRQMIAVRIYSSDGHLREAIGREGEGPGEMRSPRAVLPLSEGMIGVAEFAPGRIVRLHRDGRPAGDLMLAALNPAGGRIFVQAASAIPSRIVLEIRTSLRQETKRTTEISLVAIAADGIPLCTYAQRRDEQDVRTLRVTDRDETFDRGRWALGSDGRVFACRDRDAYAIGVYGPSGDLEQVIHREGLAPVKRTEEEIDDLRARVQVRRRGHRRRTVETDFAPTRAVILALWPGPDEQLWVRTAHHDSKLPDGVKERLEVFDARGRFLQEVLVLGEEGSALEDRFYVDDLLLQFEEGPEPEAWPTGDEDSATALPRVTCYRLVPH